MSMRLPKRPLTWTDLSGEQVRFRAVTEADLPTLAAWDEDPEIMALMGRRFATTGVAAWFAEARNSRRQRAFMIETADGLVIGELELSQIDWRQGTAELCICIGEKSYWGHGYGSAAMDLAARASFAMLRLERIYLRVFTMNERAIRLYRRMGFRGQGVLQASCRRGDPSAVLLMDLTRNRWERLNPAAAASVS